MNQNCHANNHQVKVEVNCCGCRGTDDGLTGAYTAGDGISIEKGVISAKLSNEEGNALEIRNGALYVPTGVPAVLPLIHVTTNPASSGVQITVQKGSKAYTAATDETGAAELKVSAFGTWTVSAGFETGTVSVTVNIMESKTYEVRLSADLYHIYGVSWDKSSRTKLLRTDDAATFADPVPAVGTGEGASPFDSLMPWAGMVKETDENGNVWVRIPKFWVKVQIGEAMDTFQIADGPAPGFTVSPLHMDRGDGYGERDYAYVARYKCGTEYVSKPGFIPISEITMQQYMDGCHMLGADAWAEDFTAHWAVGLLYLVEFADWNAQAAVGQGVSNAPAAIRTGSTDGMVYPTGRADGVDGQTDIQYRWLEGWWGNLHERIAGLVENTDGQICIYLNPEKFSVEFGAEGSGILSCSVKNLSAAARCITAFQQDNAYAWALFPSKTSEVENLYISDAAANVTPGYISYSSRSARWANGAVVGPFFHQFSSREVSTSIYIGGRAMRLPRA